MCPAGTQVQSQQPTNAPTLILWQMLLKIAHHLMEKTEAIFPVRQRVMMLFITGRNRPWNQDSIFRILNCSPHCLPTRGPGTPWDPWRSAREPCCGSLQKSSQSFDTKIWISLYSQHPKTGKRRTQKVLSVLIWLSITQPGRPKSKLFLLFETIL